MLHRLKLIHFDQNQQSLSLKKKKKRQREKKGTNKINRFSKSIKHLQRTFHILSTGKKISKFYNEIQRTNTGIGFVRILESLNQQSTIYIYIDIWLTY